MRSAYLDSVVADEVGRRLVSVRLPVRSDPYPAQGGAQVFLDGLLPEGWIRATLATNARLAEADTFGLLRRYGGDCAGALSFSDAEEVPPPADVRWMDERELAVALRDLRAMPLGDGSDGTVRLSLGGVQEKLIVVSDGERFGVPVGSTPSTHILKPSPLANDGSEQSPGLANVEYLCMALAHALSVERGDRLAGIGFDVPPSSLLEVGGRTVLMVARYDRSLDADGVVHRLHQEDGCQVLGLPPTEKYQRGPEGPPSVRAFAQALQTWGSDPLLDQRALLQHLTFSACTGNADLHAKNLSIVHIEGIRLAPMYDVVTTAINGVDRELGLRVGGQYHIDEVAAADLIDEATSWGLGRKAARAAVAVVVDGVRELLDGVAFSAAPAESVEMFDRAVEEIRDRTGRLRGTI